MVGVNPSEILGQINSNGKVFLVNPNGIMFGATAQVNVASLLASTLDIADNDFLNGKLEFNQTGNAASIINLGSITTADGGFVSLLGGSVQNIGSIHSPNGSIALGVGKKVTLSTDGGVSLDLVIDEALSQEVKDVANAIHNQGTLTAHSIKMAVDLQNSFYSRAINNEGVIEATLLNGEGGVVQLLGTNDNANAIVYNTGNITALNNEGKGGTIRLLGDWTVLDGDATLDVSGAFGGGEILVGGDFQGQNPLIQNGQRTVVSKGASLIADSLILGDGGRVIIWADNSTHFFGSISAKGGSEGGNGGFAEISGKNSLIAKGEVDLSSPMGEFGTLLYDPLNIQIVGGSADGSDNTDLSATNLINNAGSNVLGTITFTDEGAGTPDPFIIYESEIESTNANIVLQARNGITVSGTFGGSEVLLQNNRNLTMETRNLVGDGTAGINLTGSTQGDLLLFRTQGTGTITLLTNTGGVSNAPITSSRLQTANGAINIQSNGGNISLNGTTNSGTGGLTLNSNGGTITQGGAMTAGTLAVSTAAGNATLTNSANNITTLLASSTGGNILYREADGQSFALGTSTLSGGGDLTLQVGGAGAITQSGAVVADILNITTGSGAATLGTAGNNINTLTANSTSGTISYTEGLNNSFDLGASILGTGSLTLTTSGTGSITQSGAATGNIFTVNTVTGNATLNTFDNNFNTFAGTSTSTGNISYRDDNGFAVGTNSRGTANLTLQSTTGNITQSGAIIANNLNILTTSSNATLTNSGNNINNLVANSTSGTISYTESLNNSFILGASALGSGNLDLSVSGLNANITQIGVISGNTLTVNNAGTGSVTLNTFNNDFSTLAGNSGNVAYRDDNGFNLAANTRGTGNLTLQSAIGNITQTGVVTANILNIQTTSGNATLTNTGNNIGTLSASSTGGNFSYREADGQSFALGTSNLSGGGDLTLQAGGVGAITQSGALVADTLNITTGSGNATLGTAGNNINTLAANSTSGTISYTEGLNNSFDLGASNLGTGSLTLTTSGTGSITQSGAATGNIFTVNTATGNATLNTFDNNFNTFAGTSTSTGTVSYRDDNGFAIGTNARGTANLTLQSTTGNITQTGAVTANILNVQTTSGNVTLTNTGNNISTLKANSSSGNFSYTEASNQSFILGPSALGIGSLNLTLLGTGSVTQSGAVSGDLLTVNTSTGSATLNTFDNNFNTFSGTSTSTGTISYRDDNGFAVGTNNRGTANLTLQSSTGDITQSGAINAGNLTVISTSGNATLTNSANNITTLLASSTSGNISYREADGQSFALGTSNLSGGGDLTLQVGGVGAITQSGALAADILNITTGSGSATLGTAGNNINTLIGTSVSGTISYTEGLNNSFDLGASNLGTGNLTLTTSGTGSITQSGAATGNIFTVNTATGSATLNTFDNSFNTFAGTSTSTGTVSYRDDNGFAVGTNNRGTANLTLQSTTGNITQSGAVTANILNVQTTSGDATLTNTGNNISTLIANSNGGNISYREADAQSFALGTSTLSGGGDLSLQIGGSSAITQTGAVVADVLNITAGTAGTSTLTNIGNNINTLNVTSANASVSYREADNNDFDLATANLGTGALTLQAGGTGNITQSGAITSGTLSANFGSGNVTFNNAGNSVGTLISSSTGGSLEYTETTNNNLILGVNNLTTGNLSVNLSGSGVLTQSGALTANNLNINLGTSGNSILNTAGNNINTLNVTSTGANLTYTEGTNNSFNLGTANLTSGGDLSIAVTGTGTLTTSSPIVADVLFVTTGTNAATISNATIDTFRANSAGGLVTFNADPNQSFKLGTSAMTGFGDLTLNLSGTGVVTQTGALTGVEILTLNVGTSGNNILTNSGNGISTLFVNGNGANVSYTQQANGFFNIGTSNLGTGNLNLTVSGTGFIGQTGALIADTLNISSATGTSSLTNAGNDINTFVANATGGGISYTDANGFNVNASSMGTGSLTLNGGNSPGANIDVNGLLIGNNITIATKNDGNINLNANINATGTTALSAQTTGSIISGSNTINSGILTITTVSGHATQDGTSGGAAINTNVNSFAGNTTSGTIRVNDVDNIDLNTSTINAGALYVTNTVGNITIDDNIAATTGTMDFNASNKLIINRDTGTNLSVTTTGATGTLNLKAGNDIIVGGLNTGVNVSISTGNQNVTAGNDLTIFGRSVGGVGGFVSLAANTTQNINVGNNLNVTMGSGAGGVNNQGTIIFNNASGTQNINVNGSITVNPGANLNSGSQARIISSGAQNILAGNDITLQGGAGANTLGNIQATGAQSINASNGNITLQGGTGASSLGSISNTSLTALSDIKVNNGNFNLNSGGSLSGPNVSISANQINLGASFGTTTGNLRLNSQSLGVNQSAGNITANNLLIEGVGPFNLSSVGNNFVNFAANTSAGAINLVDTGTLNLTNVTVGTYLGSNVITNNQDLTISTTGLLSMSSSNDILAGSGTVSLNSAGLTQNAGSTITSNNLLLQGTGTFALNQANDVNTFAADVSGSLNFRDSDDLTIGTVLSKNGILTNNSAVIISADNLDITQSINSGTAITTIRPDDAGRAIVLGGADSVTELGLSNAELNLINASILRIGDISAIGGTNSGTISIVSSIAPSGTNTLSLLSGNTVTQSVGATITETNLAVRATNSVTLDQSNDVSTLAFALTATGSDLTFNDVGSFSLGTVDGITSSSVVNGDINLSFGADFTLSQNLNAGFGNVSLTANGSGTDIITGAFFLIGDTLTVTTDDGNFTQNGTAAGAAVNTTVNNYSFNTNSGTFKGTDSGGVNLITSNIGSGNISVNSTSATLGVSGTIIGNGGTLNLTTLGTGNRSINIGTSSVDLGTGSTLNMTVIGSGDILGIGTLKGGTLNINRASGDVTQSGLTTGVPINIDFDNLNISSSAGGGVVRLTDQNDLNLGNMGLNSSTTTISAGGSDGDLTLSGPFSGTSTLTLVATGTGDISGGGTIVASTLNLTTNTGNATLDGTLSGGALNTDIANFLANSVSGTVNIEDVSGVNISSASLGTGSLSVTSGNSPGAGITVSGVISASDSISLNVMDASGSITQSAEILTGTLTASSNGGNVTLNDGDNNVSILRGSTNGGNFSYTETKTNPLNTGNISVGTGTLTLNFSGGFGTIAQEAGTTLTGESLIVNVNSGAAGNFVGFTNNNDFNNVTFLTNSPNIAYTDINGFNIAQINLDNNGIQDIGNAFLTALSGNITQTGPIIADNLNINTLNGTTTLNNVNNDVQVISGNFSGGNLLFVDTDGLSIGNLTNVNSSVSITSDVTGGSGQITNTGISLIGDVSALGARSDLTLTSLVGDISLSNHSLTAGNTLTLTSAGDITGNTVASFPELNAVNVLVTSVGLLGEESAPIGVVVAGLSGSSSLNDGGRGVVLNYADITSLQKNPTDQYYLYPLYTPPIPPIPPVPDNIISDLVIDTEAAQSSVYNTEDNISIRGRADSKGSNTTILIIDETRSLSSSTNFTPNGNMVIIRKGLSN